MPRTINANPTYFSISDAVVKEGQLARITINRSGNLGFRDSVLFATGSYPDPGPGYSALRDLDYEGYWNQYIYFEPGETNKDFYVKTYDDLYVEGTETFGVGIASSNSRHQWSDSIGTVTVLDNDASSSLGNTSLPVNNNTNVINGNNNVVVNGDQIVVNNSLSYQFELIGTASSDRLFGKSGDDFGNDFLKGEDGNDVLTGYRGADLISGGNGNDEVRAGNGRDIVSGNSGADYVYGGFGLNTFLSEADGAVDSLYLKSDQLAYNYVYNKAANNPNGQKADKIGELDSFDKIFVQGADTSQLSFGHVNHASLLGETLAGVGIYADGALEAVYVGGNLNTYQIQSMTFGVMA